MCCVVAEVCLELVKTDFERAQLKYYNFLRVNNDDVQYDDDDHGIYHQLSLDTRNQLLTSAMIMSEGRGCFII